MNQQATTTQTPAIDLTKYVPKEDFDKLTNESKTRVDSLTNDLEKLRQQLLSPQYIDFLSKQKEDATRATNTVQKEVSKITDAELNSLPPAKILELATERAKQAILSEVMPTLEKRVKSAEMTLGDLQAILELNAVEKYYDGSTGRVNFNDYREEVYKLIESSPALTIEQALHIAVAQKGGTVTTTTVKKPVGSEKPTATVPAGTVEKTNFKTSTEAADDAWGKMQEKYGIGDSI